MYIQNLSVWSSQCCNYHPHCYHSHQSKDFFDFTSLLWRFAVSRYHQFSDVDTVLSCLAAAVGFHFPADVRAPILCNFWVSQFCNSHLYTIAIIFMIHECFLTSRVLSGDLQFPVTIIFLMLIRHCLALPFDVDTVTVLPCLADSPSHCF